ncbi:lasso peptide biosynthesis PqqD family chaperone [Streptomyces nigrescens]|uniref:Lasso peptide biosynthesis PqqD family chaperone n=1 Tax=Streptomyces nigrescens TaxID=1920 RepID=A0ABY7JBG8_STRNI|nr:lasso peptide biosynthesis PqqD family chaperone [Streptomyces nigrescens]WAU07835.1 lasso peptide biosynthesis PqqD family chaperone [Streptomyces nigrescens]
MNLELPGHVSVPHTDDGGVLLDESTGEYWEINQSGAAVLRMLLEGASEQEAAQALIADLRPGEISPEGAVADIRELLAQLRAAELVVTS